MRPFHLPFVCVIVALMSVVTEPVPARAQILTTLTGSGSSPGGPALLFSGATPVAMAPDNAGGFYFSSRDSRVYRVSASGVITLVAGTGEAGFNGDGPSASSAQLFLPMGLHVDAGGNLFIADSENRRVRRVSAGDGSISTVAGNGTATLDGTGGPATAAGILRPRDVKADAAGNLYILDDLGGRILKVTPGGTLTTVAGRGGSLADGIAALDAVLPSLSALAIEPDGSILLATDFLIRRVSPAGIINTVASGVQAEWLAREAAGAIHFTNADRLFRIPPGGLAQAYSGGVHGFSGDGGPAGLAQYRQPLGLAFTANGDLLVADSMNGRIRRIDAGGTVTTVAGKGNGDGGPALEGTVDEISGVAVDHWGNVFFSEGNLHRVRRIDNTGIITTVAGGREGFSGDGGAGTEASLRVPRALAVDRQGNLYIDDSGNRRVRKLTPAGIISTFAGNGGGHCAACGDPGIPPSNGDGEPATSAAVRNAASLAVGADGSLFIAESSNHRVRRVRPDGRIETYAGNPLGGLATDGARADLAALYGGQGIATDSFGNLYMALRDLGVVRSVDRNRLLGTLAGSGASTFSGDDGPALSAGINLPDDLVADRAGNVYLTNTFSHRIRRIDANGIITTVVGTGVDGLSGDGAPAASAVSGPRYLAMGEDGSLYFAERRARIRKVSAPFRLLGSVLRQRGASAAAERMLVPGSVGNSTIEARIGGTGWRVALVFNGTVTQGGSARIDDLESGTILPSSSTFSGAELLVDFSLINPKARLVLLVTGINGNVDVHVPISFLPGDVNGSGRVTAADVAAVKARIPAGAIPSSLLDVDGSGLVDGNDLSFIRSRMGSGLN